MDAVQGQLGAHKEHEESDGGVQRTLAEGHPAIGGLNLGENREERAHEVQDAEAGAHCCRSGWGHRRNEPIGVCVLGARMARPGSLANVNLGRSSSREPRSDATCLHKPARVSMVASNETKPLLSLFPGRDLRASEKTRECDDLIYLRRTGEFILILVRAIRLTDVVFC